VGRAGGAASGIANEGELKLTTAAADNLAAKLQMGGAVGYAVSTFSGSNSGKVTIVEHSGKLVILGGVLGEGVAQGLGSECSNSGDVSAALGTVDQTWMGGVFGSIAKLFGKKTVMHIHAGSFKNYCLAHPRFVSFVLKRCTRVVALSQEWADFFAGDVGLDNVQIINNVIAPPELNLNRDHDKLHILFLGHLVETKGIFDLLDVAAEHASELRDKIELHVCGAKNEEKVKDVIAAGKMSDFVKFEGWVKGQKKTDLLNLCDVFILPSYIEGLPLSILESMSYKMAILSTNIGGIPGIVHHGHNGYLFTPGDKAAMLAYILDYADHRSRVVQHGEASASAVSAFLPDAVSESLVAMYSDILHLERPQ